MRAPINKIFSFSSVDGPGNRTAIFFQGCNIKCLYCHNPETQELCKACGKCVDICPVSALKIYEKIVRWDYIKCVQCDA